MNPKKAALYGTWKSPLTLDRITDTVNRVPTLMFSFHYLTGIFFPRKT
jgi:hypothetical protein